jgi:hypothetical protein
LRFVKDAKGHAGNYFIYYKYDDLNRKIEEGTMPVGHQPNSIRAKPTALPFPSAAIR